MERRSEICRTLGVVVCCDHSTYREDNLGDIFQCDVHYYFEGGDVVFRKKHQVDDSQRNLLCGEPFVLELVTVGRYHRRGSSLQSQNIAMDYGQVNTSYLGSNLVRVLVFGSYEQSVEPFSDTDGSLHHQKRLGRIRLLETRASTDVSIDGK